MSKNNSVLLSNSTEHDIFNIKKTVNNLKTNKKSKNFKYHFNEYVNIPTSIYEAYNLKVNLTLKQIIIIMDLNGLYGEMYNIIHDKLHSEVKRHKIKIYHYNYVLHVSLYNWYDLIKIEKIIENMLSQ